MSRSQRLKLEEELRRRAAFKKQQKDLETVFEEDNNRSEAEAEPRHPDDK